MAVYNRNDINLIFKQNKNSKKKVNFCLSSQQTFFPKLSFLFKNAVS